VAGTNVSPVAAPVAPAAPKLDKIQLAKVSPCTRHWFMLATCTRTPSNALA